MINQKTIKLNKFQKEISSITDEVRKKPHNVYAIEKYKDKTAYLISPQLAEELFDYLEEAEMITDLELIESLIKAKKDTEEGNSIDSEKVFEELDKEDV